MSVDPPEPIAVQAVPRSTAWREGKGRRIVVKIALPVLFILLLNVGLYTQLAPRQPDSLAPTYSASLSKMPFKEWFALGGRWQPRDILIAQDSDQPDDLGLVAPLRVAPGDAFRVSVGLWLEQNAQGAGVLFDLQYPNVRQRSQVVRLGRDESGTYVLCGYFDQDNTLRIQANERVTGQPDLTDIGRFSVVVSSTSYSVLIADRPVVRDLERVERGGWIGLDSLGGPAVFSELHVERFTEDAALAAARSQPISQPTPAVIPASQSIPPATMRLPYQADFGTPDGDPGWLPFGGQWGFSNGALVQHRTDQFDAGITAAEVPGAEYTIRTSFRALQGTGAGVLFGIPQRDSKNGGQVVRYSENTSTLFWGYFDQQAMWHGQGSAPVDLPGTAPHTLEVVVLRETYAVQLDGQILGVGVPLVSRTGYVGLTTSGSVVAFDTFDVLPPLDVAPRLQAGPLAGARILSGDWSADDNVIQQRSTTATDLLLDIGPTADEQYRLDVTVDLSGAADGPDIGGGVLLGMANRDTRADAHIVRLAGGGRSILWGYFDGDGAFVGQGGMQLPSAPRGPQALSVTVRAHSYDVAVDGRALAVGVPFRRLGSGIGLVSVAGPVTFTDFNLSAGPSS
jgi:hypothetical protein